MPYGELKTLKVFGRLNVLGFAGVPQQGKRVEERAHWWEGLQALRLEAYKRGGGELHGVVVNR